MHLEKIIRRLFRAASNCLFYLYYKRRIKMLSRPRVEGAWPKITNRGALTLGENVFLRSTRTPLSITTMKNAKIRIEANSFLNDGVNICACEEITIGENTKIGDMVYIYDTDFHQIAPDEETRVSPVHIGKNVWVGSHAKILPGVHIGDHAVIASGSIVTKDVPGKCLAAGSPAKVIRHFEAPDNWVRA